nr:hypothetical protein [Nitrosomonas sp.]
MSLMQPKAHDVIAFTEKEIPSTHSPKTVKNTSRWRHLYRLLLLFLLVIVTIFIVEEMRTSRLQAHKISRYASTLTYRVEPGIS